MDSLLEEARKLGVKNQPFLDTLDRERIVTLQELLSYERALETLQASWIDIELLKQRVFAGFSFFNENPYSKKILPFMFFERSNAKQAGAHHKRLATEDSWYENRFYQVPAEVRHLHIHANFGQKLLGLPGRDKLRLPLLLSFSEPAQAEGAGWKVGYHVPNLPDLLSVSNAVATEYLARIIVHDIGHGLTPSTPSKVEWLHNLASLYASGPTATETKNAWERLVLEECTNPFISFCAKQLIENALKEETAPMQRHFIEIIRRWYTAASHIRKVAQYFCIDPSIWVEQSEVVIERKLIKLRDDGFSIYTVSKEKAGA